MKRLLPLFQAALLCALISSHAPSALANPQLIVKYKSQTPLSFRGRIANESNRYQELSSVPRTALLEVKDSESTTQAITRLQSYSEVEYVEINEKIQAHSQPNDPRYGEQWALEASNISIGSERAWERITDASQIKIAIIDSGCDYAHEDIRGNLWHNPSEVPGNGIDDDHDGYIDDSIGYDFQNNDSDPADDYEHGTMVFGIIGASGNNDIGISGISWNAQIMCLKVLDSEGNSTISKAVDAIHFAINHGVRIINLSWGYIPSSTPSRSLEEALSDARNAGILVVASAGNGSSNSGQNNDLNPNNANYPSSYSLDNIIAVAATDISDRLANFSYYGATTVDLGAPGVSILSTHPGSMYQAFTGTSAAAPHVTGGAALVWALNPSLRYAEVKRLLLETTDTNESLRDKTLSGGRLNIDNALSASPAAGGHLLETNSLLPDPSQNSQTEPDDKSEVSAQNGCSLSKNNRQTHPAYLLIFGMLFLLFWKIRKRSSRLE